MDGDLRLVAQFLNCVQRHLLAILKLRELLNDGVQLINLLSLRLNRQVFCPDTFVRVVKDPF